MKYCKPELLAPAGGKAHMTAAVNSGADAVYMGGMAFNARIFANNFSDDELTEAIDFAHLHGVKVYMTMNTLVSDDEITKAFEYCNYIYGLGVDAVIIQDMGLIRLLRMYLPDLPLHLSTQGTLYNAEALETMSRLGFSRVIPARELSISEIRELAELGMSFDDPVDIEVFVHGALCMCYSGQCQMSRMLGGGSGRTGNRGTCAQPCRHPYTDENGDTYYVLSPKDMCRIENIPELAESGVRSFKIEGRMKSPEYVSTVTRIYRKYIDLYDELRRKHGPEKAAELYSVEEEDMLELRQIYSRGEFTEGYLHGDPGEDILSGTSPKNQGLFIGRVIAVIDSESKADGKDERAAVRGALNRGKVLVCIEQSNNAVSQGIRLGYSDGLEFRSEDADYLVNPPVSGTATFLKDIGGGCFIAGDFDRGVMAGDLVFKVSDRKLIERARNMPEKKIPVTMSFTAREGQFPTLVMTDVKSGASVEISADHVVERAKKAATDAERIESSLARLGDTPFAPGLTGIDIQIDDDIMMPVSIVNRMRREAADELLRLREIHVTAGRKPKLSRDDLDSIRESEALGTDKLDFSAYPAQVSGRKIDPAPLESFMARYEKGDASEGEVPYILNVSKGKLDRYIREHFDDIVKACADRGILIGNPGWIERFKDAGVKVFGDYGLNIYNSQAKKAYEELGVEIYLISHEAGASDKRGIPLMITEHKVDATSLTDRKGGIHEVHVSESGDKTLIY
ncbi:MAG: U32 family peptidase [Mogibacterium sp.]|nr:U32 family peptidase [Mogibacterium sp.]